MPIDDLHEPRLMQDCIRVRDDAMRRTRRALDPDNQLNPGKPVPSESLMKTPEPQIPQTSADFFCAGNPRSPDRAKEPAPDLIRGPHPEINIDRAYVPGCAALTRATVP